MIEGRLLSTQAVGDLLRLLDTSPDPTVHLLGERDRLRVEVTTLVESIAAGVPAASVAPQIRERESRIAQLEGQLRISRQPRPDVEALRAALEQRAATWKAELRSNPKIGRLVIRRLVEPLELWEHEPTPEFVKWKAQVKTAALLESDPSVWLASPAGSAQLWTCSIPGDVKAA